MSEANIAAVRRWFEEVWNQGNEETITEMLDEDSVCHGDGVELRGPEQFRQQQFEPLMQTFSELRVTVESILGEGDEVAVRWSGTGRHTGNGLGIPPTGETVELRGISWIKVRDGKLGEGWQRSNIPDVLEDLAKRSRTSPPPRAASPF